MPTKKPLNGLTPLCFYTPWAVCMSPTPSYPATTPQQTLKLPRPPSMQIYFRGDLLDDYEVLQALHGPLAIRACGWCGEGRAWCGIISRPRKDQQITNSFASRGAIFFLQLSGRRLVLLHNMTRHVHLKEGLEVKELVLVKGNREIIIEWWLIDDGPYRCWRSCHSCSFGINDVGVIFWWLWLW